MKYYYCFFIAILCFFSSCEKYPLHLVSGEYEVDVSCGNWTTTTIITVKESDVEGKLLHISDLGGHILYNDFEKSSDTYYIGVKASAYFNLENKTIRVVDRSSVFPGGGTECILEGKKID